MTQVHLIHHWCWIGTADSEESLTALLEEQPQDLRLDLDQYHILCRFLLKPPPHIQLIPLSKLKQMPTTKGI